MKFFRRRKDTETWLTDEIQSFLDMAVAAKIADGVSPDEARRLAMIELGGVDQVKEQVRTSRPGQFLDETARDLRYALRMFARNPGFTAVILLTLTLGIGANTAIFSLIDALMLQQLPVKNPQELVQLNLRERTSLGQGGDGFSYAIVRGLDQRREIFAGVAGFSALHFDTGAPGAFTRVPSALVTGSFYRTLGLEPAAGRLLVPQDDEEGAELVAVISYGYWERQYARSPSALGQTIVINAQPVSIVGVSPRGFTGTTVGESADITIPVAALPRLAPSSAALLKPGNFWLRVLARPATGETASAAAARLNAAWPALADTVIASHWAANRRKAMAESLFIFTPGATGWSFLREMYTRPLFVLMAVAGVVLLIACANIASLFLARATARRREIAVRLAIGAGRRRIVRQLVIEGAVLSFAGAALGIAVAWPAGRLLVDLISTGPFGAVALDLTPNWHVLAFSAVLATVTGVVFGLAPAFQTRRADSRLSMTDDVRTGTQTSRLLPSLVVIQVALALVLVAGAGLFVRTLRNLQTLDPGFKSDGVLIVDLEPGGTPSSVQLLDEVRAMPGVVSASVATHTPLNGSSWSEAVVPSEQPIPEGDTARMVAIAPQFLDTLQIPIVRGRDFSAADVSGGAAVAIINERYAERHFKNADPIGRRLATSLMGKAAQLEIVGMVKDVQFGGLRRVAPATVYVAYAQFPVSLAPSLVIRAAGPPARAAEAIRAALQARVPATPIEVRAMTAQVSRTIVQERLMATLAAGFGALAIILSSVGLYGLLAYSVAQRSREIGIRMALGAQASGVVSLVILNGARLVALGLALGLPAAWAASRSIESMLFGLKPTDPMAMGGAVVLLVVAALLASYLPARRAARVDPLTALRCE